MCFHEPESQRAALNCNSTHFPMINSDLLIPYKILIPAPTSLVPLSSTSCKYLCLWKSLPKSGARPCGHHSWWFWGDPGDTHTCGGCAHTGAGTAASQAGTWWGLHSEFLLPNQPQVTHRDLIWFHFLCQKCWKLPVGSKVTEGYEGWEKDGKMKQHNPDFLRVKGVCKDL